MPPIVSIIMRSMNDIEFIESTLKMVFEQTMSDFELINVDSGSTDGTFEIIRKYNPKKSYQIKPEEYIPGKVLNDAVAKCEGEIIVFNNSDCVPLNNKWLENLIIPLREKENTVAAFGNQVPRKNARPLIVKDNIRAFGDGKISATWGHFFSLATSAAKKNILEKYPFDPEIQYSEDVEWSYRMKKTGFDIEYVPDALVEHSHNYTLKEVEKRFYNEGLADGRIYGVSPGFVAAFAKPLIIEYMRDFLYLLKNGKLLSIPYGIVYRFIQKQFYYKGRKDYDRSKK